MSEKPAVSASSSEEKRKEEKRQEIPIFKKSERLALIPQDPDHANTYILWLNHYKVRRLARNEIPRTMESSKAFTEKYLGKQENSRNFDLYHLQDKKRIGNVGLNGIDWVNRNSWLGLEIGEPSYWKDHYGTEGTELILAYAFDELNLHRVQAGIFEDNLGSQGCARKVGMKLEGKDPRIMFYDGEYHSVYFFGILEHEWRELHSELKSGGHI